MASLHTESNGYKIRWRDPSKRPRTLHVGRCSKKSAAAIFRHVSELIDAQAAGRRPEPDTELWLRSKHISQRIRDRLVALGLTTPANPKLGTDEGSKLGAYLDSYIESRTDCKPRTIINFKQARRLLCEHFGETKPIAEITPADASRFRRWMLARPLAESTVSKHIKRCKTMFAEAVRDRLLTESPFADEKGGVEVNASRQHFVTEEVSRDVLAACINDDWRVIFALARWAGMRCPSEVLTLRWNDILWDQGKIRIDSPKTGLRFCPIFPEVKAVLSTVPRDDGYLVKRYRWNPKHGSNLGTQLKRIIESAGHKPWPKLLVNLRSTRRTELEARFPNHVCNAWLGHGRGVAERHYLQVTADDFANALVTRAVTGLPMPTTAQERETEQVAILRMPERVQDRSVSRSMPPLGLEERGRTLSIRRIKLRGGNTGGNKAA